MKIVIMSAFLMSIFFIDRFHDWGDDFSLYLNQAKALVNHDYHHLLLINTEIVNSGQSGQVGPYLYPIGFPTLISPFFIFSFINFFAIKIFILILFGIGIIYLYKILALIEPNVIIVFLTILSVILFPGFVYQHNQILSDTPNFTFTLISVFHYILYLNNNKKISLLYSLIFGFIALSIRTTSIVLFPVYSFIYVIKNQKKITFKSISLIFCIIFPAIIFVILNKIFPINPSENEMKNVLTNLSFKNLYKNIYYYLDLLLYSTDFTPSLIINKFIIKFHLFSVTRYLLVMKNIGLIILFIFLLFCLYKVFMHKSDNKIIFYLIISLLLANLFIYILIPYQQGYRYIFIVIPFLFYLLYKFNSVYFNKSIIMFLLSSFLLFFSISGYTFYSIISTFSKKNRQARIEMLEAESIPNSRNFNLMMKFIKDKLNQNVIVGSAIPRAIYYFTGIKSYTLTNPNLKYVLIREGKDEYNLTNYKLVLKSGKLSLYKHY